MKFQIPFAKDPAIAEEVYSSIKLFIHGKLKRQPTDRRIALIRYEYNKKEILAKVGKLHPAVNEPIIAILEFDDLFCICTLWHGTTKGEPILVEKGKVSSVEDFE